MIILFIVIILFIIGIIFLNTHKTFVMKHSNLLKNVKIINSKYHFHLIEKYRLQHEYDNSHFFEDISPSDYLIYQLVFIKKEVLEEISKIIENNNNYDLYLADIKDIKVDREYDCDCKFKIKFLLDYYKNKFFKEMLLLPVIKFTIDVILIQTNINGRYIQSKYQNFKADEIVELIWLINDKNGSRYNNKDIWDAICRVERGKVSNKLRFLVYNRDGNRCRKCGRYGGNLEVDHIIPISKGGKSTLDNLQTLCHNCNVEKSDYIESIPQGSNLNVKTCPLCGAPLRIVNGKYGKFYGCMNYPKCKYTLRINK